MQEEIPFEELSNVEQQAFCDFQWKEWARHMDDLIRIQRDLDRIYEKFGIKPRNIYVGKWIEI